MQHKNTLKHTNRELSNGKGVLDAQRVLKVLTTRIKQMIDEPNDITGIL